MVIFAAAAFITSVWRRLAYGLAYAVAWLILKCLYRVKTKGLDFLPKVGPGLIVCNHISMLDGIFLYMNAPRRVRFLVWAPYFKIPIIGACLRLGGAIPIDENGRARDLVLSLHAASEVLSRGELLGIFAEGALTRSGAMLPFRRGFSIILKKAPAPIIPACIDRLWGSIFSYRSGRLYWKWPSKWRYPVLLMFGKPLPPGSEAWQVRQEVQKLQADCFNYRKREHKPVHRQFVRIACRHPFRSALIDAQTDVRLNNIKTLVGASLMAARLRRRLDPNKNVGLLLPTVLGGALANIAVALLGKTAVNLNYTASMEAVLSAMKQCGLKQVVTSKAFRAKLNLDLGPEVEYIDLEDIRKEISTISRITTLLSFMILPGYVVEYWFLRLGQHGIDDLATIIFSSGSTGDPKGVMLSQHNIISNIESAAQALNIHVTDRLLAVLPFFHSFGYTVTLWLPLIAGASTVYYPDPRQGKEIGEITQKYGCTIFVATPTFLRFYLRRCEPEQFKTVRLLVTGAEKLPLRLANDFKAKMGIEPYEGYGCTELSPVVSVNVLDVDVDGMRQIGHKPGTIGQPVPGVAVKIVDPNTLSPLPPGTAGMLLVFGPNVMVGYLGRPDATAAAMQNGWYITGDIAKIDDDGFITITDRLSRFSKIGGEMVPHQRVEDEIHNLLGTTDRIVAVTGVPDEKKGERLIVLHTKLETSAITDLTTRLATSGLPNLWLPDDRAFFEIPEMPVLGSGKLDLQRLKKLTQELVPQSRGVD